MFPKKIVDKMKKLTYLSELTEGQKFQVPSMALPNGHRRTYIYTQHQRVKTLFFNEKNGNGALRLPEQLQFKLKVDIVN